jgi:hypothetical protein
MAALAKSADEPGHSEKLEAAKREVEERLSALQTFDRALVDLVFEFRLQADLRMLRAEQEIPISVPVIHSLRPFLECTTPIPSSVPGKFQLVKCTPEALALTAATFPSAEAYAQAVSASVQQLTTNQNQSQNQAERTRERDTLLGGNSASRTPV